MAPSWRRAVVFALEGGALLAIAIGLAGALDWIDWSRIPPDDRWPLFDQVIDTFNDQTTGCLWALGLWFALLAGWGIIAESTGGTPLQRLFGLQIINRFGEPAGVLRLVIRHLVRSLSIALLGLGSLWGVFDRHRRSLHDMVSGAYFELGRTPRAPRSSRTRSTTSAIDFEGEEPAFLLEEEDES